MDVFVYFRRRAFHCLTRRDKVEPSLGKFRETSAGAKATAFVPLEREMPH